MAVRHYGGDVIFPDTRPAEALAQVDISPGFSGSQNSNLHAISGRYGKALSLPLLLSHLSEVLTPAITYPELAGFFQCQHGSSERQHV